MTTLQSADALRLGTVTPDAVFAGTNKVWPGGFSPADLTGLKVWLEASDYTSGAWTNRAAGGLATVLQSSPSPVPAAMASGRPVVRFKANEGCIRITSGSGVGTDWTLVYVGRLVGPNAGRVVDAIYPPNNLVVGIWNGFIDVMYDAGFTVPDTRQTWDTAWHLYAGDGHANISRLFSDGIHLGSVETAAGWGGTFAVSGYADGVASETCDCEVGEVIQYDRKLSDAERKKVEDYLRAKWWGPYVPPYDPATSAFVAASGLPAPFIPALDGLVLGLKSKGLWAKMKAIWPFIGGTAALHKWNLMDPRDLDAAYRLTFAGSAGVHSTALGYRANPQGAGIGSGSYANTFFVPSAALTPDSTHLAFYSLEDTAAADRAEMGCYNWPGGAGCRFHLILRYQGVNAYYFGQSENGATNVGVPAASGLFSAARLSSSVQSAYRNGVLLTAAGLNSVPLPPVQMHIGSINEFANRSDVPCGFASVGDGLTDAQMADLYTVVQAYQTALGRAI